MRRWALREHEDEPRDEDGDRHGHEDQRELESPGHASPLARADEKWAATTGRLFTAAAVTTPMDEAGSADRTTGEAAPDADAGLEITGRVVLSAFAGGAAGLVAMAPALLGLPAVLGLFQAEPLVDVAELGRVVGVEPSLGLGVLVFAAGGVVALPLLFVVAGGFLPPREPRAARGAVFATIMWTGFVLAYWPGERAGVLFLGLSLGAHWIYGYVLGGVMERFAYIPEHAV